MPLAVVIPIPCQHSVSSSVHIQVHLLEDHAEAAGLVTAGTEPHLFAESSALVCFASGLVGRGAQLDLGVAPDLWAR